MNRAVALFGPTASGKTALAAALADRLPLHLVSCDAVQVYRGLDAATAKPRGAERRHVWALIDCIEPGSDVNLGWWVERAEAELAWAWRNGRLPLLVGGTGLYLQGLVKGVARAPGRDERLRERLRAVARRRGGSTLWRLLRSRDPAAAGAIAPTDIQRLVRALEVALLGDRPLSSLQRQGFAAADRFRLLRVGLAPDRGRLDARIDRRAGEFIEGGLLAEVDLLLAGGRVREDANALKAIGYREACAALRAGGEDREALTRRVQRNTRRLARRQMTWFRKEPADLVLDPEDPAAIGRLDRAVREFLRD